jgi:hypothetical protein
LTDRRWKPQRDARGWLVGSKKPVTGLRRFLEELRNALIAAVVLAGLVQLVVRNVIVTGVVGWIVFLAVLVLQILAFR